ncbi:hypothetical protein Ahia01_000010200 [Argonauta hians]
MFYNTIPSGSLFFMTVAVCFTVFTVKGSVVCIDCSSKLSDGRNNKNCPVDGVSAPTNAITDCDGKCIYRSNVRFPGVYYRSCSSLHSLPEHLPDSGCYVYGKDTFCFCNKDRCNEGAFDFIHNKTFDKLPIKLEPAKNGTLRCYDCPSKLPDGRNNTNCPVDGESSPTNAINECKGKCIYRSNVRFPGVYYRSCSDIHSLPEYLPNSGCYVYGDDTFCFCSRDLCNGASFEFIYNKTYEELPIKVKTPEERGDAPKQCYVCLSKDIKENPNCPGYGNLKSLASIYKANCTGVCLTRTLVHPPGVVARSCSDNYYNFPKILPKEGCYRYYSEIICFCKDHLCNFKPLGKPHPTNEIDYLDKEAKKNSSRNSKTKHSANFLTLTLFLIGILLYNFL